MTDTTADANLQTRRRKAVDNDRVIATIVTQREKKLTQLRASREQRCRAHAAALASVRLEGQDLDSVSHALAARWVEGELSDEEELAELDRHFGHPRARTQR